MHPAIRVTNLTKRYRLGSRVQGGLNLTERLTALLRGRARTPTPDFLALDGVSFEVRPGEVVGIISRNGAGKSTLLKVLSRTVEPTGGRIELRGRVGSLLEVGTGFHPELTGRENVFMNGSVLGMSRRDIARRFDEIVAFAGVEQFLDTPVKRYSSGMYVRLAFAVAAHLEPEILIVDEVLAVGDHQFQEKCVGKLSDAAGTGRTVLFVSHNLPVVQKLCTRAVLLAGGRVQAVGRTADVVAEYLAGQACDTLAFGKPLDVRTAARWGGTGEARVARVTMFDPTDAHAAGGFHGGPVGFRFEVEGDSAAVLAAGIQITDESDRKLVNANTLEQTNRISVTSGGAVEIAFDAIPLRPGRYKVGFWLGAGETRHIDVVTSAAVLEVLPPPGTRWVSPHDGVFRCPFTFRLIPGEGA